MSICQGKESWPELVGWCGELAAKTIENEKPGAYVIISSPNNPGPITLDFRCDRVVVRVDEKGIVHRVPYVA